MSDSPIRTRFAPAPTGLMHLGNVRAALMNYLFAKQHHGSFIIRIEDTDQQRNFDPGAQQIMQDLHWLQLTYQEGPEIGGPYVPYFQSQRTDLYTHHLQTFIDKGFVYRCFCTPELLEKKRERQIALKMPPRYDRTCLGIDQTTIEKNLAANTPFVWRLKLPHSGTISINDIARGTVQFDLKHFSDQPLTRADGSITFLFANFVDDLTMHITHIFRGEDHLTNTAVQAIMYQYMGAPLPTYWHMPILCNNEGKKLSKRDFGFSLTDLRQAGYLPEAITNYLALIGGGTFEHELMPLDELVHAVDFTRISTAGQIKYDPEKLTWLNHKWIDQYNPIKLAQLCKPFLVAAYPEASSLDDQTLSKLIQTIKSDMSTLRDCTQALHFYFYRPTLTHDQLIGAMPQETAITIARSVCSHINQHQDIDTFLSHLKADAKKQTISIKHLFAFLRLSIMGQTEGPAIADLIAMIGKQEAVARIKHLCTIAETY